MAAVLTPTPPALIRRRRRLPLWPLNAAGVLVVGLQFWQQRFPGAGPGSEGVHYAWIVLWILYAAAFIGSIFLATTRPAAGVKASVLSRLWLVRWLILPLLAGFMAFATQHDLPFRAAFLFSRPALTRLARQTLDAPLSTSYPAQDVGLFHATDMYALPHEMGFIIYGDRGLVYAPDGHPAAHNEKVEHFGMDDVLSLGDGWYLSSTHWNLESKLRRDHAALLEALAAGDPKAAQSIPGLVASLSDDFWGNGDYERYAEYATGIRIPQNTLSRQIAMPQSSEYSLLRPDIRALVRLGPVAVPALVARLTDGPLPSTTLRQRICQTLAVMGPDASAAVPALIPLLHDPEPLIREFAAWTLGEIGPAARTAIPDLLTTLNDPDLCVRYNTILVLRRAHSDAALALPAYARFVHALLTAPPVAIPHRPTLPPNYYDRRDLNSENYVNIYEYTMTEALDAIADYGPDAAPIAPSLAADFHATYLSPLFAERSNPNRNLTVEQRASLMMCICLREKLPPILVACGPAAAPAAPELDAALRIAVSIPPPQVNDYAGSPWPPSHALAAVALGYKPAVDFLVENLNKCHAQFIVWSTQSPDSRIPGEVDALLLHSSILVESLNNLDPTDAALRAALESESSPAANASGTLAAGEQAWQKHLHYIFVDSDSTMLQGIIDRLNSQGCRNHLALIRQLDRMGPAAIPAIPTLVRTLHDYSMGDTPPNLDDACFDLLTKLGPAAWEAVPWLESFSPDNIAAQRALAAIDRNQPELRALRQSMFIQKTQSLTGLKLASTDAAIDALIGRLNSDNPSSETQLLASLGPAAHRAIPALLALLPLHPNSNSPREFAAEALAKIAPPDAKNVIRQIVPYLQNPRCRMDIVTLLANLGPDAAPYLRTALNDDNPYVRFAAIDGLLKMGPAAIPDLPAILEAANGDTGYRRARDLFLDRLPTLHAPPALVLPELKSLLQSTPDLRLRVAITLGNMGKDALPLRNDLEQRKLGDFDPEVRKAAAAALRKIDAP